MRTNTMKRVRQLVALLLLCSVPAFCAPGTSTSYTASLKFAASSTTDNAVISGASTAVIVITEIDFSCTQTTAGLVSFKLTKRSTADTGGTTANFTAVANDSHYAASKSVPVSYTGTGPTAGTAVGDVDNEQIGCPATSTAVSNLPYVYKPANPIVLHGAAETLALSLGGAVTGGTITVSFKWTENTTQ